MLSALTFLFLSRLTPFQEDGVALVDASRMDDACMIGDGDGDGGGGRGGSGKWRWRWDTEMRSANKMMDERRERERD